MLTNAELASWFEKIAELKELAGENAFAANAYRRAGQVLERTAQPLASMEPALREQTLGKGMAAKATHWLALGSAPELEELEASIPEGVLRMLEVPGFGIKKVGALWREHKIDDFEELVARAEAGTLAQLPGFGKGTQEAFLKHLATVREQEGKWWLHKATAAADDAIDALLPLPTVADAVVVGQLARSCEVVEEVAVLAGLSADTPGQTLLDALPLFTLDRSRSGPGIYKGTWGGRGHFALYTCAASQLAQEQVLLTGPATFLARAAKGGGSIAAAIRKGEAGTGEFERVAAAWGSYLEPELRDNPEAAPPEGNRLIEPADIKGILHCHSTYSDGQNSLQEMAAHCQALGYAYFGIADHSQTASYANGLSEERLLRQWEEIDRLNEQMAPFKILKGIESDILPDGSLDYPDRILAQFDYVVASVHAGLRMSADKATERLLRAIQNPYTTILGHATGRLLLKREGYPLDMEAIIETAARHKVSIEINANPHRLDLDWRFVYQAAQAGVLLSINPDAHKVAGFGDMRYGIAVARKGGLRPTACLNAFALPDFTAWLAGRKP